MVQEYSKNGAIFIYDAYEGFITRRFMLRIIGCIRADIYVFLLFGERYQYILHLNRRNMIIWLVLCSTGMKQHFL